MTLFEFNFKDINYNYKGTIIKLKKKNFDLVLSVIVNNIIYKGADKNGYTPINSKRFLSAYYKYEVYVNYLIYRGIIERDYYIKGMRAFGYRFSDFSKQDIKIHKIIYYPSIKENVKTEKQKQNIINVDNPTLKRLKKDFNSCVIDFDLQNNQIEKTYNVWGNYIDIQKWFRNNLNLYKWQKGYKTFCFTSHRLYNNFTSLSSHIRKKNIKLNNNEDLVEFDIHNSFPLMVAIFMRNENPNIIMDYDFKEYCSSVIGGTFYKDLTLGLNSIRNCQKQGNEDDFSARLLSKLEVKQLFQIHLNSDIGRYPYLNGMRPFINEYMSLKYSCVHEKILDTKKYGKNNVYYRLVEIESQFIFGIIKELYETFDDIRILTCHDAIYVGESFKERVQVIWDANMKELIKDLPYDECEDNLDILESTFIEVRTGDDYCYSII